MQKSLRSLSFLFVLTAILLVGGMLLMKAYPLMFDRILSGVEDGDAARPSLLAFSDENGGVIITGMAPPVTRLELRANNNLLDSVDVVTAAPWALSFKDIDDDKHILRITYKTAAPEDSEKKEDITGIWNLLRLPVGEKGPRVALQLGDEALPELHIFQVPAMSHNYQVPELRLSFIRYNKRTMLDLAGTAPRNTLVQIYINQILVGWTMADGDGLWHIKPVARFTPGTPEIRIDALDVRERVIARTTIGSLYLPPADQDTKEDGLKNPHFRDSGVFQANFVRAGDSQTMLTVPGWFHGKENPRTVLPGQVFPEFVRTTVTDTDQSDQETAALPDKN